MTYAGLADVPDEERFGGKARDLGAALCAGLPVPDGIAIPVEPLVQLVSAGDPSPVLVDGIRGLDGRFIVRSSGIAEDGEHASFAGQHHTESNVLDADGVIEALEQVHASGPTESVVEPWSGGHDFEWAFRDGDCYLFQRRDITTGP